MFGRKKQREKLITQIVEEVNNAPTVKEKLKVIHDTACNEEKQKMLTQGFAEQEHKNEEATKQALIIPFIAALGYAPSDPAEVHPEALINPAAPGGDKVDYAVLVGGSVRCIVEAKAFGIPLDIRRHKETPVQQLARYFAAFPSADYAVLSNGIEYRIYAAEPNALIRRHEHIMNDVPFLVLDMNGTWYTPEIEKLAKIDSYDIRQLDAIKAERESVVASMYAELLGAMNESSALLECVRREMNLPDPIENSTLLKILKSK